MVWITLADGCGVYMVVLVKDIGFVKVSNKRPDQFSRNKFKRREKKRAAVAAVRRAAAAFESQCLQNSGTGALPCAIVLSAVCLSHAGGLLYADGKLLDSLACPQRPR
jgi:hypothetical protein